MNEPKSSSDPRRLIRVTLDEESLGASRATPTQGLRTVRPLTS